MRIQKILMMAILLIGGASVVACGSDTANVGGGDPTDARPASPKADARPGPKVCNFTNCDGCCDGNVCNSSATTDKCGVGGQACQTCSTGDQCFSGSCAAPTSDCTGCDGCCSEGTQCLGGASSAACGASGNACVACPSGEVCNASGTCETIACDATTCPNGCCNALGKCVEPLFQNTDQCGPAGGTCSTCSTNAIDCVGGTCIENQPCLDYCTTGCCNASGQCLQYVDQTKSFCGTTGTCSACTGTDSCIVGVCSPDPAWTITIRSAVVSPTNAQGLDWDRFSFGGKLPDPYVVGNLAGDAVPDWFTATIDNTTTPNWIQTMGNYSQGSLISLGFEFGVRDSDVGIYETIGQCTIAISLADLQAGSKDFACGNLVPSLKVDFTAQ